MIAIGALVAALVANTEGRGERSESRTTRYVVARVVDGDTLVLRGGDRVRLIQIDAPELGEGECYAEEARGELARLVPPGAHVRLESEPRAYSYSAGKPADLDKVDRFGRLLAYVIREGNVNVALVHRGAASPWFYGGVRGRHARELMAAVRRARANRIGLWRACPRAKLDPLQPIETI